MKNISCIQLEDRGVLSIAGEDAAEFLQGLVSNDVSSAAEGRAVYAALLTPQGKFLHDFFILQFENAFLLDCEIARLGDLGQRFSAYKLRADIELMDATEDWCVAALLGDDALATFGLDTADHSSVTALASGGLIYRDPRTRMPGLRALMPRMTGLSPLLNMAEVMPGNATDYENIRIAACVPDGSRDMTVEKATLMEFGFEALNGVDFNKGCYVGQELTARMKYRGLSRRRLERVLVDGPLPPPGTPVMAKDKEVGEIRTGLDKHALALLRLDRSEEAKATGTPLKAGEAIVTPDASQSSNC